MAKLLKLRRGTTSQHSSFTGAEGEVTVDTDKETLVVHDGSTAGGHPVAAEDLANVSSSTIAGRLSNDSIATSKIAAGALPTDVTIQRANITSSSIKNSEVAADAAIAGTKIAPDFGSQNIATTGTLGSGNVTVTGNITVSGTVDGVDVAARNTLFGGLTSSSGVLTDGVTATTQAQSDNTTKVSTTAYVRTAIANAQAFPSGTVMLFYQASAPTGWTKVTTQNNKALRVVSGTGGGTGGSNAFTDTLTGSIGITANAANTTATGNVSVANATAGGNVSIANASTGGTVNNHTLTTAEMPSHSHSYQQNYDCNNVISGYQNWGVTCNANQGSNTGNTGGGGGHSHGFTGGSHNHNATFTGSAHTHNASFTGSAHNHSITVGNLDLAVQYVDVILASKD
tara:strand:+ start:5966 stop:7159 length:1194 start_codon:yes stop_codon:yes gene_type:complete